MSSLKAYYQDTLIEAGCDEAGRGCLAGPVFAAAVILPKDFNHPLLTDSKQLSEKQRYCLRDEIEKTAVAYSVAQSDNHFIDLHNILKASVLTMHKALEMLKTKPEFILIDGNYFITYKNLPHKCIIKGDSLYFSIAAASILAKTYRDDFMTTLHNQHPEYGWIQNKGYPTKAHRIAIRKHGITDFHRKSFNLSDGQLELGLTPDPSPKERGV
jgi:ribonuclease HII